MYTIALSLMIIILLCILFLLRPRIYENYIDTPSVVVVTAYYPLKKNKHGHEKYMEWINNFFNGVKCDIICFCPGSLKSTLESLSGVTSRVTFVAREFNSFDMTSASQMTVWEKFHKIDPQNFRHSPELYAVWAAKQEYVRYAMNMKNADIYVWCDIGCFRDSRKGDFKNTYKYIKPGKITGLDIDTIIGGGVLAGDKNAWNMFSKLYLKEIERDPHGIDQVIFKRILNDSNAVIITPPNTFKHDEWFYLTYIFDSDFKE